jgi:hypothetical protein
VAQLQFYRYLTSSEDREEFHTPESGRNVVVKSTAAYIVYFVVVGLLTPAGFSEAKAALLEATARRPNHGGRTPPARGSAPARSR